MSAEDWTLRPTSEPVDYRGRIVQGTIPIAVGGRTVVTVNPQNGALLRVVRYDEATETLHLSVDVRAVAK